MKALRSTWSLALLFAIAHFAASIGLPLATMAYGGGPEWVGRATSWIMAVLTMPLLFALHDSSMSIAVTVVLIAANSIAAGLIIGLFAFAFRRGTTATGTKALLGCLIFTIVPSIASAENVRESTVGIPGRITDLVLPGSEIEVLPQDAKTAVVLRIVRVSPHGSEFRYDLEWTGLDVGRHDLRAFLRRKDGTSVGDLPAIAVEAKSVLPAGMVKPNHPPDGVVPRFGGYRAWMIGLGVVWVVGLVVILLGFRKKRAADLAAAPRPRTLAERLRPLVESAMAGTLGSAERAQLELGLVAYWRRRLGLDAERPDAAIAALRAHPEAGPLLAQLDAWLHKPGPRDSVDVDKLLAPYKDLAPDALDMGAMRS